MAGFVALVCVFSVVGCGDDGGSDGVRTIGILRAVASGDAGLDVLVDELADLGWTEGDNLEILGRDPTEVHPDPEDAGAVVTEWVDQGVDLVLALSSTGARAAADATTQVPVLFLSNDPMATGLIENERRPEANLTGATYRVPGDRTLATAEAALGELTTVGCLYPLDDAAAEPSRADLERGAEALSIELRCAGFTAEDVAPAVAEAVGDGVEAVVLVNAPGTVRAAAAIESALTPVNRPVIANTVALPFALLVLEPDTDALYQQLARQADRLLDGAPVAEVPVEDPGRFRLVVDLRIAERLGIEVPDDLLETADEVIRS